MVSISLRKGAQLELQAMLLRNVLESLSAKASKTFYGSGISGDVWRSQMMDQVAQQIARYNPDMFKLGFDESVTSEPPQGRTNASPWSDNWRVSTGKNAQSAIVDIDE